MTAGLYIHIPFCLAKCHYCDFLSDISKNEYAQKKYTRALIREMEMFRASNADNKLSIETVYIGGGTPTALPPSFLIEIINAAKLFYVTAGAEITAEANPGTLTRDYLRLLKDKGVNRLSIGLQAWQDELLKTLGRVHNNLDFIHNFQSARKAGFSNINIDVMFSLPGQTMEQWKETMEKIIALGPEHISAYSLTPAEGTLLWKQMENGKLILPGDETDREMYHYAIEKCTGAGYNHYEISNFAKPGHESRHNLRYWKRSPYFGFGLGAHSFDGSARWKNTENMDEYINKPENREAFSFLTLSETMAETLFLGLRLMEGVKYNADISEMYGAEINRLCGEGLLKRKNGYICLTKRGMDLANRVFMAFIK